MKPTNLDEPFFWRWFHHIVHLHTRVTILLLTRTISASRCPLLASHCNEHTKSHRCDKKDQTNNGCHNDGDVHRTATFFHHIYLYTPKASVKKTENLTDTCLLHRKDGKLMCPQDYSTNINPHKEEYIYWWRRDQYSQFYIYISSLLYLSLVIYWCSVQTTICDIAWIATHHE